MGERYAAIQEMFRKFLQLKEEESNNDADQYWLQSEEEPNDLQKAKLLAQGMSEGSALCAQELGRMYLDGRGVSQDLKNARTCLQRAAVCGLPIAMLHLGLLETKTDAAMGMNWICKSAIYGDVTAYHYLNSFVSGGEEVREQIEARMSAYYEEIHDKKDANARENQFMGWCYATGTCCPKDFEQAQARWIVGIGQESYGCEFLMRLFKSGEYTGFGPGYQKGEVPEYDELMEEVEKTGDLDQVKVEREGEGEGQGQGKGNGNLKTILSIVIGLAAAGSLAGVSIVGLVLGILAFRDKKGAPAVIGIILNAIVLLVLAIG